MSQQIADWLVYNGDTNQKDWMIPARRGADCLLPAYGKWIGLLWSGFCYDNRENRQRKDNQSSSAASLTPLFTPIPKRWELA